MEPGVIIGSAILGVFVLIWAGSFVLAGPIGKAIAQRISGERADPEMWSVLEANAAELETLRNRVVNLEDRADRMVELEERVDFAERMLGHPPVAGRLPDESTGR